MITNTIENIILPEKLNTFIGSENKDFVVRAKSTSLVKAISSLGFSIFWIGFTSIFMFLFLGPLY